MVLFDICGSVERSPTQRSSETKKSVESKRFLLLQLSRYLAAGRRSSRCVNQLERLVIDGRSGRVFRLHRSAQWGLGSGCQSSGVVRFPIGALPPALFVRQTLPYSPAPLQCLCFRRELDPLLSISGSNGHVCPTFSTVRRGSAPPAVNSWIVRRCRRKMGAFPFSHKDRRKSGVHYPLQTYTTYTSCLCRPTRSPLLL